MTTRLYSFLGLILLVGLLATGCQRAGPKRSGAICIAHLEDWLNRNEEKVLLEDEDFGMPHNNAYLSKSGQIKWNAIEISDKEFSDYLSKMSKMTSSPTIRFSVHRMTDCDRVRAVSTTLERSDECRDGYGCSLEGRWHYIPSNHPDDNK